MKLIRTEDAAGQVLCHDITQIIPGEFKGARFRKGHIIQPEDIPVLLSIGKENLYVWEKKPGILHEDEAAALLYKAAAGKNIHGTEPKEGKIELIADCDGLLKINREALLAVNRTPQMMIATIHGDLPVKKGQKLAGTRIIPLVIEQEKMDAMQAAAGSEPILNVLPMQAKKFAVITTGSEVFKGRIEDKFTPILVGKLAEYGCEMTFHKVCDDDPAGITAAILEAKEAGCELIFTTGGMSVDPDDRTPLAIRNTGADIVTYGAPVLPGAMFLVSYLDGVPVCGLPGCVMYAKRTIFDLLLPRLLADDAITAEDIARLGEGGLCLGCAECHWPNCGFGLATGNLLYFLGAFYLYFINSVFISLATFIGVRVMHFQRKEFVDKEREKLVKKYIIVITLATMCPAIYLTYGIVKSTIYEASANNFINEELDFNNTQVIDRKISFEKKEIRVVLIGNEVPETEIATARDNLKHFNLAGTKLVILQGMNNDAMDIGSIKAQVMEDFYKNSEKRLLEQQERIKSLENELKVYAAYNTVDKKIIPELKVLYPTVEAIAMAKTVELQVDSTKTDTLTIVLMKFSKRPIEKEQEKISEWLKARVGAKKLKLIVE